MASAPDFAARFQVLHGAVDACADGGEGLPLGVVDPNQDGWFIAEFDDLAEFGLRSCTLPASTSLTETSAIRATY